MAETLDAALEREHREIDGGIEEYLAGLSSGAPSVDSLVRALAGLRRHIYLEEVFLFPPLRAAGMMMPIFVMLREHGELWRAMDRIDTLVGTETDNTDAHDTVSHDTVTHDTALANACRELLAMLDTHNSKEELIIYSQADTTLSPEANAELTEFLAEGRMPEGWVCHGAPD